MKLNQLQYFYAVCRLSSVTKAAAEMHIAQPSVSSAIRELEAECGVTLFNRLKKRLVLTKEGEYFLQRVIPILEQVDSLSLSMKDLSGQNKPIKIGVPPMIGTYIFPDMFIAFKTRFPEINLESLEYGSVKTKELVENEAVDAAFIIMDDQITERYNSIKLFSTQYVYCVSKLSELASHKTVDTEDIKDEPLILFNADSYQNNAIKMRYSEHGFSPHVILYSSQFYTIRQFVESGIAGAFMFEQLVQAQNEIVGIPLKPPLELQIGLIWKKGKKMYSNATKFIRFAEHYNFE